MNEKYRLTKKCSKCGNVMSIMLTKEQAAFDLYDTNRFSKEKCIDCGEAKSKEISIITPDIDMELLDIWGKTLDYHFWEQDEDLMLSTLIEVELIISAINKNNYIPEKIGILLSILFVILYDVNEHEMSDIERVILKYLKENAIKINEYGHYIDDYLKEKVLPMLNK